MRNILQKHVTRGLQNPLHNHANTKCKSNVVLLIEEPMIWTTPNILTERKKKKLAVCG